MRRRTLVVGASAGLALAGATTAVALPPGGAVDKLGTPAGSLEITSAALREGKVQFCVRGFVTKDGAAPQQFQVKFDDFGSRGIGQFQPDASGTYCGEIATDRAAYATKASADDKIPAVAQGADANLCDTSKQHWLRVLTGTWAHPNGSERSIARDIAIDSTCGTGGKAAAPSIGTVVGSDTGVLPPTSTPGGTTTTPGGTTTTPGTTTPGGPTTPGTTTPVVLSGLAKVRSSTVAVKGTVATLQVRRTAAVGKGKITIRSAAKLAVKGRKGSKVRTLVSGRPYSLTGQVSQSLRLKLTTTGRSVLRTRARLDAVVTITPNGGTPTTAKVVLKPTKTTKK
ncbi:hypothetical protein [Patulibacter minatonensis]|uniref:hypothetical protein n=1 Tax=Patulibacter minatonensis TaxID=298163 RepID=UPI0004B2DF79|nr:hypothetical protein [Patulibacter minatonensis]